LFGFVLVEIQQVVFFLNLDFIFIDLLNDHWRVLPGFLRKHILNQFRLQPLELFLWRRFDWPEFLYKCWVHFKVVFFDFLLRLFLAGDGIEDVMPLPFIFESSWLD